VDWDTKALEATRATMETTVVSVDMEVTAVADGAQTTASTKCLPAKYSGMKMEVSWDCSSGV